MHNQDILAAIDQQQLREAYLRNEIQQATKAKDREFAATLVEHVLGTRSQAVKQAAIAWVIENLGTF